jgi:hypothetical protein
MSLVVPNVGELLVLDNYLKSQNLFLALYSNNVTPGETDTFATYTPVAGGGYALKTLVAASWTNTAGAPSFGIYAQQTFTFTGVTTAPGTIYGLYIYDAANVVRAAQRFATVPFTPIAGARIRITPRLECS